jgi:hypothetical protein
MFHMLIESHQTHSDIENSLARWRGGLSSLCMLIISYTAGAGAGKKISSCFADVGAGAGPIQVVEGEMNGRQNESMNMMKYGRGRVLRCSSGYMLTPARRSFLRHRQDRISPTTQ